MKSLFILANHLKTMLIKTAEQSIYQPPPLLWNFKIACSSALKRTSWQFYIPQILMGIIQALPL
ncbi:hypothetical protein D3C86_1760490 [compost metagenome]